jgi:alpha-methylacyl-CoA racemase
MGASGQTMQTTDVRSPPPLAGVRVLEFAGLGPAPLCCMLLSDMGAEVVRIQRQEAPAYGSVSRGRRDLILDLKAPGAVGTCLEAIEAADVLVEGFRPGVMERLGLGPEAALARNPRLIYGRMTGWGQEGPLAQAAGHDINYIAVTGALAAIGPPGQPSPPPLNLVGDYGGGGLYLAWGIALALFERERSGKGQVIDAAIIDGTASLMAVFTGDRVPMDKSRNFLGGAAPYYRCYLCADGRQIAVGPLEPQFYEELLQRIGAPELPNRFDPSNWPELNRTLETLFATRTRDQWCSVLEGTDACFAPVLELDEAPAHPHMQARGVYEQRDGMAQPAPAPRFSRTPGAIQDSRADGAEVIARWRAAR